MTYRNVIDSMELISRELCNLFCTNLVVHFQTSLKNRGIMVQFPLRPRRFSSTPNCSDCLGGPFSLILNVTGALFKRPDVKLTTEVCLVPSKNEWSCSCTPQYTFMVFTRTFRYLQHNCYSYENSRSHLFWLACEIRGCKRQLTLPCARHGSV